MTYAELKQAIQDYTENDETTFVANLDVFIRNAENRVANAITMPNFKATASGTMTIGDDTVVIPANFIAPLHLSLVKSGDTIFLLKKEPDYLQEVFKTTATGTPEFYALRDDQTIQLAPPPNAAYPYELYYRSQPPTLVSAGTTWLSTNAPSLLLYACLVEAAIFMKDDQDMLTAYLALYQSALETFTGVAKGKAAKDTFRTPDERVPA